VLGPIRHKDHVGSPRSAQGVYLIVSDIDAARAELVARGAEVSEAFHAGTPGAQFQPNALTIASSITRRRSLGIHLELERRSS
jgi:hypothetical protein